MLLILCHCNIFLAFSQILCKFLQVMENYGLDLFMVTYGFVYVH